MNPLALIAAAAVGLVAGAGLTYAWFVARLRTHMLVSEPVPLTFDDAEAKLRERVPAVEGWGFPIPEMDFTAALARRGFKTDEFRRAKIFFLCNPGFASSVVAIERKMIGMMPCSWALYETREGQVFLARLNMPMMAQLFGGPIGEKIGQVGRDEHTILEGLTR